MTKCGSQADRDDSGVGRVMDARRLGSMTELLLAISGEVTKYGQGSPQ